MNEVRRFVVTGTGDPAAVLAGLADRGGLRVTASTEVERTFLDTPDGRLDGAGMVLELRRPIDGDEPATLTWSEQGRSVASMPLPEPAAPRFAADLPPWPAAHRLARVMEMRALVPGPVVRSRLLTLAALDREEKTTARVIVDASTLPDGTELPLILELHQLRGYQREAEKLQKLLTAQLLLEPTPASIVVHARALSGATFLRSKLRLSLDPSAPAADAWRTVLRELTAIMTANFAGTIADVDSEFLHDFRVAVRRTRSVLQEGRGVLPPAARQHFREGFKWLGDVTTPQRDADVHLLDLPDLAASLPPERKASLAPLRDLLEERQQACHARLVADLRSLRRARLGEEWARFLVGEGPWPDDAFAGGERGDRHDRDHHGDGTHDDEHAVDEQADDEHADGGDAAGAPDALEPAARVVAARIRKARKRLVRDGRAIDDRSPATALHDLRKDAKRLRYLLECFGSLFPADDVSVAVKPLKALQETLGTFQDTEVQARALAEMGEKLVDRGAGATTLMAMGAVIEHVSARGAAARRDFPDRFAAFDSPSVAQAYARLSDDAEAAS